ncbi:MAG: MBL fold metallo-hydrolase [Oceanicaulis sp.]
MASRFTALAVRRGEAFLLETPYKSRPWAILVDSGNPPPAKRPGMTLFQAIDRDAPTLDRIDIAVCTHNDQDHAGGFPRFLKEWVQQNGREIGELWLPGRWLDIVEPLVMDPSGSVERLSREIRELRKKHDPKGRQAFENQFDRLCEAYAAEESSPVIDVRPRIDGGQDWPMDEETLESLKRDIRAGRPPSRAYDEAASSAIDEMKRKAGSAVFRRLIDAGRNIIQIAQVAIDLEIPVRWMDPSRFMLDGRRVAEAGQPGLLEVVNAVEGVRARPLPQGASMAFLSIGLNLTIQNIESLVLYRPETHDEPGVLFTGDSALRSRASHARANGILGGVSPPKRPILITVPHHGSKNNDDAYPILDAWLARDARRIDRFVRHGAHTMVLTDEVKLARFLSCANCKECPSRRTRPVTLRSCSGFWSGRFDDLCETTDLKVLARLKSCKPPLGLRL